MGILLKAKSSRVLSLVSGKVRYTTVYGASRELPGYTLGLLCYLPTPSMASQTVYTM